MRDGLVNQEQKFKKRIASTDTSTYKVVARGQLVVGFPIDEGVLSFQNRYDQAIVSPAYEIWDIRNPDNVEAGYLEKYLRSPRAIDYYRSKLQGTTARRRSLPKDAFLALPIALPAISEQRRIVQVLDKVDALRMKRRETITLLDNLTQSIFLDMFGDPRKNPHSWVRTKLSDLTDSGDRINYGVVQPGDDYVGGVPLIRVGDLANGRVDRSILKRINPTIEAKYARSRLKGIEILIACVGSVGSIALASDHDTGSNIARAVARIPISSNARRVFVAEQLKTKSVQKYFLNELRTVAQPTLNIKQLSETIIMLPPDKLQEVFSSRLAFVNKLRQSHVSHLIELNALFASFQYRAFCGELSDDQAA
jgi:type I restriction enzyme S subunit